MKLFPSSHHSCFLRTLVPKSLPSNVNHGLRQSESQPLRPPLPLLLNIWCNLLSVLLLFFIYNILTPPPYTSSEMLMRVVNVKREVTLTYHIMYWKSESTAYYFLSIWWLIYPSKTLKIDDAVRNLIALTFNEASGFIKDHMQNLQAILSHLDPSSCEPCDSSKYGYAFDSIHLDTYNRFAEKVSGISQKSDYIWF